MSNITNETPAADGQPRETEAKKKTANYVLPSINDGPQWLVRLDHYQSEAHRLSWRYIRDSRISSPLAGNVSFPGFILDNAFRNQNFLFADSYTFGPDYTNEFRFSYGRLDADAPARISPLSVPQALTLPQIIIPYIAAPGIASNRLQFRYASNFLFQETQTKLTGRHAFRYGAEFLQQLATQRAGIYTQGQFQYQDAVGYSGFANFLDDFSGPSGQALIGFGVSTFHPDQFRQSYFFQDNWKATPTLALTLGLRYENFGQLANSIRYPAFAGFDPALFLVPNQVNRDTNNFGPAFGFAWSPSKQSGWFGRLFGDRKTVWRGGYQVSYDAFFSQIVSAGLAAASPNGSTNSTTAPNSGRGLANFSSRLPAEPSAPSPGDPQNGVIEKHLRSPYTERWSFGFERQLRDNILLDVSYIGSESHKLTTRADLNPRLLNNQREHPDFGQRLVRTSQGNSDYHALQWRVDRRFARGFQLAASYTWSRNIDSSSEGVGQIAGHENLTSMSVGQGGLKLDRGLSDYDRAHRFTLVYLWAVPGPRSGLWKYALGGWSVAGITSFQTGAPFTLQNGSDRNNDGIPTNDRPDIGNPSEPLGSRAAISSRCATGYQNMDTGACVSPADIHWIEGKGLPNRSTVGRNTLLAGDVNNFDVSLSKSMPIGERKRLEFRWDALNAFNHPQFVQVPPTSVKGPPGHFLNRDFTDSGIRSMWAQVKLRF